ncbi:MAG: YeeE/YedE family protein [Cyclobacteriaceae bacterium]
MLEFISQPWPWYVAGPLISLTMFLLLYFGRNFGVSSTLRTACAMAGAGNNISFFKFDWKNQIWNLVFVAGAVLGGFIATQWLSNPEPIQLSANTVAALEGLGVSDPGAEYLPADIFSWSGLFSVKGAIILIAGGFLVGFGARYAGGCTSGHAISGLSNLQVPSLIAVIGFFIGGLLMTFFILPQILSL